MDHDDVVGQRYEDEAMQQWMSFTSGTAPDARRYLEANEWNVEAAADSYFRDAGHETQSNDSPPSSNPTSGLTTGGARTLGGAPAPAAASSSSASQPATSRSRREMIHTLGGLAGQDRNDHTGHDHSDSSDAEAGPDMFAGGEKSGLAVQNPGQNRNLMEKILRRARENAPRPGGDSDEDEEADQSSHFKGRGVTLGGDDAPSQVIEDPSAAAASASSSRPAPLPRVTRTLHIWRNGYSIDDGPLQDPTNNHQHAAVLQMILAGHAPPEALNVQRGQQVDLDLDNRRDEDYKVVKKYVPFGGSGQRLGEASDAPAASSATTLTSAAPPASTSGGSAPPQAVNVDTSQPTVTLQIRLGDGTRLSSRFNTTHSIADVYAFVDAASPASSQRSYVLSATFPPRDFEDRSAVISDLAELKRGGVVVQKWR